MPGSSRLSVGTGRSFGTFGELLQGVLPSGADPDFLVTLPIARYATASFVSDPALPAVKVFPPHKRKSLRLAADILARYGLPAGGVLTLQSELPEGKGLASSSADLVATARAVAACYGIAIPTRALEELMGRIEPSDGVMHSAVVAFHHRRARLRQRLGHLPSLTIVAVDEGGTVDTVAFNKAPKPFSRREREEYLRLLTALAGAVRRGDLETVGQVATRSAIMNQRLLPKRHLADMLHLSSRVGALGVVATHSGTCLGILLSPRAPGYLEKLRLVRRELHALAGNATVYQTLSTAPQRQDSTALPAAAASLQAQRQSGHDQVHLAGGGGQHLVDLPQGVHVEAGRRPRRQNPGPHLV